MTLFFGLRNTVLDASALIALLGHELGAEKVEDLVPTSVMSAVNLTEVLQWGIRNGQAVDNLPSILEATGLRFVDYDAQQAADTAALWPAGEPRGLGLGDRACLALGRRMRVPVVTADQRWGELDLDVDVRLIR